MAEGDDVSLSVDYASGTFDNKNAGQNKPVTISGLTLTGEDADKYQLNFVTGVTGNINPKGIVVTAVARSKVYGDGESCL